MVSAGIQRGKGLLGLLPLWLIVASTQSQSNRPRSPLLLAGLLADRMHRSISASFSFTQGGESEAKKSNNQA
jgi:hypothetical protein